jgi:hypothetical protein
LSQRPTIWALNSGTAGLPLANLGLATVVMHPHKQKPEPWLAFCHLPLGAMSECGLSGLRADLRLLYTRCRRDSDTVATISAPVNSSPYAAFLAQMDAVASQQPVADSGGSLKAASVGVPSRESRPRGRSQPAGQASRFRSQTADGKQQTGTAETAAEAQQRQPAALSAAAAPQPGSQSESVTGRSAPGGSRQQEQQQQQQQQGRGSARAPEAPRAPLRRFVSDGAALGSAANIAARSAPAARAADPYSAFHLVSRCMDQAV